MKQMMLTFHNTTLTKPQIMRQLRAHAKADEIVKGRYWLGGRGCAVGCTIHGGDHLKYEPMFGIPVMLARFEDIIFEGLPNAKAKEWPIRFMKAIKPGTDLSRVGWQFLHWMLTDEKVNPGINHPLVREAIRQCADVLASLAKGETPARSAAESAESAESAAAVARSAARSARSAAAESAESAESAARSAAARSAAWAAAEAAAGAAGSAAAGSAAARSAESAAWAAAQAAAGAAGSASSYSLMAGKLIELIKAAGRPVEDAQGSATR